MGQGQGVAALWRGALANTVRYGWHWLTVLTDPHPASPADQPSTYLNTCSWANGPRRRAGHCTPTSARSPTSAPRPPSAADYHPLTRLTVSYYYCTYLSRYCIAYATIITLTKLKVQTRRAVWRSSHSCWVEAPSGKDLTG